MDNSPDEPRFPWLRKTLIILIGIGLLILVISLLFVTFPIRNILEGKADSVVLDGQSLHVENLTLIWENNTLEKLQSFYLQEQTTEFSICLKGTQENHIYRFTSWYLPSSQRRFNQVIFDPCSSTLALLHTHPYKHCSASSQDIDTLHELQRRDSTILMMVMCEKERFAVYR